ncbi:MAG: hypothetical protein LUE91_05445 [Oscillospiraceae bacterium]|nr:hypothetical protein [Oscillospiraceae bacterium]
MQLEPICTLGKEHTGICGWPRECALCGWEQAERDRRRELLARNGLTLCGDGLYRLKI